MPFAPEYVRLVLGRNFEDATRLFLSPLMAIHRAHLVMLAAQGIVSRDQARALARALDAVSEKDVTGATCDGTDEDLFCHVNRLLAEACGPEIAGRLHTARSRNDIDMTMYRMRQRGLVLDLFEATLTLRGVLLAQAARHRTTLLAALTHTQPAQPTTIAHYLLAVIEQLERDAVRLRAAYATTNRCPLGACAITGTGFPIDRALTADLLGFDSATGNTYGSIATVDYLLESLAAASVLMASVGRVVQDLLLWTTAELGYLRLPEGFVQTSSVMPQKRNPVALEHARAIASRALGQATAVLFSVHNTPFGDIVDTEDDLQPLVFSAFGDATRAVALLAEALRDAELDVATLQARASANWITLTELADTLARDHDVPFQAAHAISARLMERQREQPTISLARALADISATALGRPLTYTDERLAEILSPVHFIEIRRTPGGPAVETTATALESSRQTLAWDDAWVRERREALAGASARLAQRSREP